MAYVRVADARGIEPGNGTLVEAGGRRIALFNVGGTFYAIDDTCTHRGGPLSEGELTGDRVTCPWHGAEFDVKDGSVLGPPAPRPVSRYSVRVTNGEVEVDI